MDRGDLKSRTHDEGAGLLGPNGVFPEFRANNTHGLWGLLEEVQKAIYKDYEQLDSNRYTKKMRNQQV